MLLFTGFLVAHNLGSETKKATGIPMFMAIGQCGSVLGSHIFPKPEGPHYMWVHFFLVLKYVALMELFVTTVKALQVCGVIQNLNQPLTSSNSLLRS